MGSSDDRVYAAERIIQKRIRKVIHCMHQNTFVCNYQNCVLVVNYLETHYCIVSAYNDGLHNPLNIC